MNPADLPQSQLEAIRHFGSAETCHNFLASLRWPDGVRCAHCGSENVGALVIATAKSRKKDGTGQTRVRRLWNCKACGSQFTVKTGTIFEDSALPLEKWLPAVWLICNAKNGISSCELARALLVTQKTAWHMGHRIRTAMKDGSFTLKGEVEADETFIGGKARNMHKAKLKAKNMKTGHGSKLAVAGILQRSTPEQASKVKTHTPSGVQQKDLQPFILNNVKPGSALFTDAFRSYNGLELTYAHETIDHAVKYAEGNIHTNGMENYWSLVKRMIHGTYIRPAAFHLFRYLDEQSTRFNERKATDAGRFLNSMRRVSGRRLTYKKLTGKDGAN